MSERQLTYGFWLCVGLGALVIFFGGNEPLISSGFSEYRERPQTPLRILLVGDVMLARRVESIADSSGISAIFTGVTEQLTAYPYVVGNFEAAIPAKHKKTKELTMIFSVKEEYAKFLKEAGFTHLSLANNHALDFGGDDLAHTRDILNSGGLVPFGQPEGVSSNDVVFIEEEGSTIALVPIHAVGDAPSRDALYPVISYAQSRANIVIVYIHWSEEYKPTPPDGTKAYAHMIADIGADIIVGHHPHVMQGVERYNDTLIFYSLGNFIFDQYWNQDVQTGLALGIEVVEGNGVVTLMPLRSAESVPRFLDGEEALEVLGELARRSDESLTDEILRGSMSFESVQKE
jgi:gamma-polyglutamate biosynthesis protein CapA